MALRPVRTGSRLRPRLRRSDTVKLRRSIRLGRAVACGGRLPVRLVRYLPFVICHLSFAIGAVGPTCPAVLPSIGRAAQTVGREAGI